VISLPCSIAMFRSLHVRVFDEYMLRTLAKPRFNALLLSIFAGTAAASHGD